MTVTDDEIAAIQKKFPDLYLNDSRSKILGEFSFNVFYDGNTLQLNPSKQDKYEIFSGYYEIEICLNSLNQYGLPSVKETGGKIVKFAEELKIRPMDLHLNGDYSCCLGIFTLGESVNMKIIPYVVEYIFSFFAWQAFANTYRKKAPWGEYSHAEGYQQRSIEIITEMGKTGRNDSCPCGSNKKFKKCCQEKFEQMHMRVWI